MPFAVRLSSDAVRDLEDICDYAAQVDGRSRAQQVLTRIEDAVAALSEFPDRGSFPDELLEFGIRRYREVFFKPWRIVYRVGDDSVFVLLIADGRRDMRTMLLRRLLRADAPAP